MESFAPSQHSDHAAPVTSLFNEACNYGKNLFEHASKYQTATMGVMTAATFVVPELKVLQRAEALTAGVAETRAIASEATAIQDVGAVTGDSGLILHPTLKTLDELKAILPEGSGLDLAGFQSASMIEQNGVKIVQSDSGLFGAGSATRMSIHSNKIILESPGEFKPSSWCHTRTTDELNLGKLTKETIALDAAGKPVAWTYENPCGIYGDGTCTHILRDIFGERVETSANGAFNFMTKENKELVLCRDGFCTKVTSTFPTRNANLMRILENPNGIFGPKTATTMFDSLGNTQAEFADGSPFIPHTLRCQSLPVGAEVTRAQSRGGALIFENPKGIAGPESPVRLTVRNGMNNTQSVLEEFAGGKSNRYDVPLIGKS